MTETELDATYGPMSARYGVSPAQTRAGVGIALASLVVGGALAWAGTLFHRGGTRSSTEGGLVLVGLIFAVMVPLVVLRATWRARGDTLELRARGIVRRSQTLGLKHCRYADLARIEHLKKGSSTQAIDVFTGDGTLIRLGGFDRDPIAMIDDLGARAKSAGAGLRVDTVTI
jgi:hypothetical protein